MSIAPPTYRPVPQQFSKNHVADFKNPRHKTKGPDKAQSCFKILREVGTLLRTPAGRPLDAIALEAVKAFREYEWELDAMLQTENDPVTLRNRTTFRLQGVWKKFELGGRESNGDSWVLHPRTAMETRFANPGRESDILFLGGWEVLAANTKNLSLDFSPQAGFSMKKLAFFGEVLPGAEIGANLKQRRHKADHLRFWQLSALVQYGFVQLGDPHATILGLVFKWVL
ncbi:MAG: hypothetical protein Q8P84_07500 [Deltaproteobacteria bacterium]|nr:hypothetical protein [Deltaproteobacteria bacterium]